MSTPDDFSPYVADLLSGTYDCVDRISVRGYFPLGQTSGGLLTWWNQLFPNTQLSEQQLRKLAGDFARRVHAFARKHKIALRYFAIGDKTKHPKPRNFAPPIPSSEGKQSRKASTSAGYRRPTLLRSSNGTGTAG